MSLGGHNPPREVATSGSIAAVTVPHDEGGAGQPRENTDSLSLLERALRQALASVSREQVLQRVIASLPADPASIGQPDSTARPRPGLQGKVEKVSVSMPAELTEAVRSRTGAGGFSRYVADAVQARLSHDQLGDLLDELEGEHGQIPARIRQQTRQLWPDESQ